MIQINILYWDGVQSRKICLILIYFISQDGFNNNDDRQCKFCKHCLPIRYNVCKLVFRVNNIPVAEILFTGRLTTINQSINVSGPLGGKLFRHLIHYILLFLLIQSSSTSGSPKFIPDFQWGSCCSIIRFLCSVLQIVVCPFSFGQGAVCPSNTYSNYSFVIFF